MLIKIYGSAIHGVAAQTITIEVNVDTGVGYHLVGFRIMPSKKAVTEFLLL
jgi:hypothetical protein